MMINFCEFKIPLMDNAFSEPFMKDFSVSEKTLVYMLFHAGAEDIFPLGFY